MAIITDLFSALATIITGLISAITGAFTGITAIFYTETGFTTLGALLLIGFGLFFVMFAWRVIKSLLKR